MTRTLVIALFVPFLLAGCGGGAKEAGPVPTGKAVQPATSSPSGSGSGSTSASSGTSTSEVPLCSDRAATIKAVSQQGAAGTIATIWRVTNDSASACRSLGFPGMDFHSSSGWLDVQVQRGGLAIIDGSPQHIVVEPGKSFYFMSFWSDVDTQSGPCKEFDRVKITLPDNFAPARLAATGCLDPGSVRVGPVSTSVPS